MKTVTSLKKFSFRLIISLSVAAVLSHAEVYGSEEMVELGKTATSKLQINDNSFIEQADLKYSEIVTGREALEDLFYDLSALKEDSKISYMTNVIINDLTPDFLKLTSNNFVQEAFNTPLKKAKKIKGDRKKDLEKEELNELSFFNPKRHGHLPGYKNRKNKINQLQHDDICVQHRLTNESNLTRMDREKKDITNLLGKGLLATAQLNSIKEIDQVKAQNDALVQLVNGLDSRLRNIERNNNVNNSKASETLSKPDGKRPVIVKPNNDNSTKEKNNHKKVSFKDQTESYDEPKTEILEISSALREEIHAGKPLTPTKSSSANSKNKDKLEKEMLDTLEIMKVEMDEIRSKIEGSSDSENSFS